MMRFINGSKKNPVHEAAMVRFSISSCIHSCYSLNMFDTHTTPNFCLEVFQLHVAHILGQFIYPFALRLDPSIQHNLIELLISPLYFGIREKIEQKLCLKKNTPISTINTETLACRFILLLFLIFGVFYF